MKKEKKHKQRVFVAGGILEKVPSVLNSTPVEDSVSF